MSEQTIEQPQQEQQQKPQQSPEQLSDVLLVMDKEKRLFKRLQVLTKMAN